VIVKLFYLLGIPSSRLCKYTRDATDLVLKELGVESIDMPIMSYLGTSFDADDDREEEISADEDKSAHSDESQGPDAQARRWRVLESLHEQGTIGQISVSKFSSERLSKFLPEVKVRPTVDQINVKDCCVRW
jgi:glutamate--cysteine ligase regulatory subunit